MNDRIYYVLDPYGRLIVNRQGRKSNVKRFRKVLNGRFKVGPGNNLYYEVYKPQQGEPQKIGLSGKYSLDKQHNLVFSINKWNNKYAKRGSRLRAKLIGATGSELLFTVGTKTDKNKRSFYVMTLNGAWQIDKRNRLTFGVKKEDDSIDSLTFFNAWSINKNNEIEYSYGKGQDAIVLKGKWDIKDKNELKYTIAGTKNSALKIASSLARLIPVSKNAYVKFEVTIDITCAKKIKRKLSFMCKYKPGTGKEIAVEIAPSRKTLNIKIGPMYLESFIKDKEKYAGGGVAFRW